MVCIIRAAMKYTEKFQLFDCGSYIVWKCRNGEEEDYS
jgi:hypothetical protein